MIYDSEKNVIYDPAETLAIKESTDNGNKTNITVMVSNWYNRLCTVPVAGITSNSKVYVYPKSSSKEEYESCGIYCSAVGEGHIVLGASSVPQNNINITVVYENLTSMSAGQKNARANGYLLGSMRYNIKKALPSGSSYGVGNTTGLPYSSVSAENKFIGINVSLYTFLSAVANPMSIFYTTLSKSWNGVAYYGTVCTSLVCAAWKIPIQINTYCFNKGNYITKLGSANDISDIKVGDMLLSMPQTHAALIVDINDDLTRIVVSESWRWKTRLLTYSSLAAFRNAWGDYEVCRYSGIDGVKYLVNDCYINPANYDHTEIDFPDIMTNFGDKCLLLPSDNIELNAIVTDGYTGITLYKDGNVLEEYQVSETITLGNLPAGDYKAVMTGPDSETVCYWTVADISASLNGNIISFASSNCIPIWVTGHPEQVKDGSGKYTSFHGMKQESKITDEERASGTKDISELLSDPDVTGMVQVHFWHKYGVVEADILL